MSQYGSNIVKAKWKQKEDIVFLAGLKIQGIDSVGFIHRITQVISIELGLNIRNLQLESSNGVIIAFLTVYVSNIQNLKDVIAKLQKVEGVRKITRLDRIADFES
jgi:GTP pyrophosphokinase